MTANWQRSLWKLWLAVPIFTGWVIASVATTAVAQITPDGTLGNERSKVTPQNPNSDRIDGGAVRGVNLFHSFQDFNVGDGRRVDFANPVGVENIFSRVTGGNGSNINGTLGVLGNANLFFLNPNGILFGSNAKLDIRGSFVASTASSFGFGNGVEFSAANPQAVPVLKVNLTPGLQVGGNPPGKMENAGNLKVGGDLTLWGGTVESTGKLEAPTGKVTVEAVSGDAKVRDVTAQTGKFSASRNLILEESQLRTNGDLSLLAQDTVRVRDSVANPFLAQAGGNLLVQGNQSVDIFALNHPGSGLASGRDMLLRSMDTVGGDAHYWVGGNFKIEKLDGNLGNLLSPYDPIIRSQGDVTFDNYAGSSLHIFAGGSVNIQGFISIKKDKTIAAIQEDVILSDGTTLVRIDGNAQPTLDIRAGTTAFGLPGIYGLGVNDGFLFASPPNINNPATSADIKLGLISGEGINILLTNQYKPNNNLSGGNISAYIISSSSEKGDGGAVTIDSRGEILVGGIDSSSLAPLGNGGRIILKASGDISPFIVKSSSSATNGNSGNGGEISIQSTSGKISILGDINSSSSATNGNSSNGGEIKLSVDNGDIQVGNLISKSSSSNGNAANGGKIDLNALGRIKTTIINSSSTSEFSGNSKRGGEISISTNAEIETKEIISNSFSDVGNSDNGGNLKLSANTGNITTETVNSQSFSNKGNAGNGGKVELVTDGTISTGDINSGSASPDGISKLGGQVSLEAGGNISTGEISSNSYSNASSSDDAGSIKLNTSGTIITNRLDSQSISQNANAGDGGEIDLKANGSIATGDINSGVIVPSNNGNLNGANGGNISLTSTAGSIITGQIFSLGSFSFENIESGAKELGNVSLTSYNDLILSSPFINTTGNGLGGNITLTSLMGKVSLGEGLITTDDFGQGSGGNIQIIGKSIFMDNTSLGSTSSGNENGGNILISTPGSATLNNSKVFTHLAAKGVGRAGNIRITAGSTSLNGGNLASVVSSEAKGSSGDIDIITSSLSLSNKATLSLFTESNVVGNAGNININTNTLFVKEDSQLQTFISGRGNAGVVNITTSGLVSFDGKSTGVFSIVNPEAVGNGGNISITTPSSLSLTNGAGIFSRANGKGDSGDIDIQTGSLNVTGASQLATFINGQGKAGDVIAKVDGSVIFDGESTGVFSIVNPEAVGNGGNISITTPSSLSLTNGAGIFSRANGKGDSGDIDIQTGSLNVTGASQLATFINGQGKAGDVIAKVDGPVIFDGKSTGMSSIVNPGAEGNGGNISITTPSSLSLTNGARIFSSADGKGDSGDINIQTGSLNVTGASQLATFISGQGKAGDVIAKVDGSVIFDGNDNGTPSGAFSIVNPKAVGNGGTIDIKADSLSVTNGAQFNTFLSGTGRAGDVKIAVDKGINFDGNSNGFSSGIFSDINPGALGKGGDINIASKTGSLSLTNQAELSAKSSGDGNAGNISVTVPGTLRANNGNISTISNKNSGGIIDLKASYIRLNGDSDITTFVSKGEGSGGDINLTSALILAFSDSDILAYALEGRGGNITLDTPIFLGFRYFPTFPGTNPRTLDGNGRVDINASGALSNGDINLPDTDPSRGLTPLPSNFDDPSNKIDNSCSIDNTRSSNNKTPSQFVNTGRGGLPPSPSDPLNNDATITRLATINTQTANRSIQANLPKPNDKSPEKIIEAQGWKKLPNGNIKFISQTSSATPQGNWQNPSGCYAR